MTSWWAIDVHIAEPEQTPALAEWLVGRTCQALEERSDGSLVATVPDRKSVDPLIHDLHSTWGSAIGEVTSRAVPDDDWSTKWREGLGPRQVGRITLVPSWMPGDTIPEGPIITLDPESAFGSGGHGSTRTALLLLDRHLQPGDTVLDLGSGSGILSLAAATLGAAKAIGIEIDADAIPVAQRNAERNGLANRVAFLEGAAAELAPLVGPAQMVVCNILLPANVALLPTVRESLAPGGIAIFSGMETSESAEFTAALTEQGFLAVDETLDEGWAVAARC
jgi:ribosomal protein L11 methyltransferase